MRINLLVVASVLFCDHLYVLAQHWINETGEVSTQGSIAPSQTAAASTRLFATSLRQSDGGQDEAPTAFNTTAGSVSFINKGHNTSNACPTPATPASSNQSTDAQGECAAPYSQPAPAPPVPTGPISKYLKALPQANESRIPDYRGLVIDSVSCQPYSEVLIKAIGGLSAYVNAAIAVTRHADSAYFADFFRPYMNATVREVFENVRRAIDGEGSAVSIRCDNEYEPLAANCDNLKSIHSWVGIGYDEAFLNICPSALLKHLPYPNLCTVPEDSRDIRKRQSLGMKIEYEDIRKYDDWMEIQQTLADLLVQGLSTMPPLNMMDEATFAPPLAQLPREYRNMWGARTLMYNHVPGVNDGFEDYIPQEYVYNWMFVAKKAWGRSQWRKNQRPERKRYCEQQAELERQKLKNKPTRIRRPARVVIKPKKVDKAHDELRRLLWIPSLDDP